MSKRTALAAVTAAMTTLITACATAPTSSVPVTEAWYKVAVSGSEEAFVDTNSIRAAGGLVQVQVKENYLAPRPAAKEGKTFRSARTDYRLDCARRKVAMRQTEAFEGTDLQGNVVQKASRSEKNLIWVDAPRASVFGEVLDYGCKNAPAPGG
ncbi:MAG: hypothetical protein JNK40_12290 [Chromatiales bacterium]|nr:hypothetical protein [Chromatiales bacterium]